MNVSIWIGVGPLMAPGRAALQQLLGKLPRLDSLFFPGGDGGQLAWPEIIAASEVLRASHPQAGVSSKALSFCCASTVFLSKTVPARAVCLSQVWVSAQELTVAGMEEFWQNVSQTSAAKQLAGVVYGEQE
eukprot:SAG22_NODE_5543_length_995_cov_2.436384_1_plen_131_part_00